MNLFQLRFILLSVVTAALAHRAPALAANPAAPAQPNVIVILADDLGYHDLGVQGATDVRTPHLDSIATNGIRFTAGYVTAPLCSPSRAGLITGRHQQRFGHETNPGLDLERHPAFGLPLAESTIANRLKDLGYATAWIGKSHLGGDPAYHPLERGFDEFFGFIEGHHHYTSPGIPTNQIDPILRGRTPVPETNYLTYAFAREITNFVARHASGPFFIYAPFNAVHVPLEATSELLLRFPAANYPDPHRRVMAAMLAGLDDAIGTILAQLRALHLDTNTLIVFTSDNGGPSPSNGSLNTPYRGYKTQVYEGGIRVPFLMQWPAALPAGRTVDTPISTLDLLPTAVAAAGGTIPTAWQLDGMNLLPWLRGTPGAFPPQRDLFWRIETNDSTGEDESSDGLRAIRSGAWKLLKPGAAFPWELYHLDADPGETNNLAERFPETVQSLQWSFRQWESGLAEPRWAYNQLPYAHASFVPEDVRIGGSNTTCIAIECTPDGSRAAWIDQEGRLWEGALDPDTGAFTSGHGRDILIDTEVVVVTPGNGGLSWVTGTNGAALYYSRPDPAGVAQLWRAGPTGPAPVRTPLTSGSSSARLGIQAGPGPDITPALLAFLLGPSSAPTPVWASETTANSPIPIPSHATAGTAAATVAGRWLPGGVGLAFPMTVADSGWTQIGWLDPVTGQAHSVTDDEGSKTDMWGFLAPEFGGELCLAAVVDQTAIAVYRDLRDNTNGHFRRVATLTLPASTPPALLHSMRPIEGLRGFNGVTYFAACASQSLGTPGDSGVWVFGLGPATNGILTRRVDQTPSGLANSNTPSIRSEPRLVAVGHELRCYYLRDGTDGGPVLHLAGTGIRHPDHESIEAGFATLQFTLPTVTGTNDSNGRRMSATETLHLVAHQGRLFAGTGSRGILPNPPTPADLGTNWTGAQILIKDSPTSHWRVDELVPPIFRLHLRVEALAALTFTTQGRQPLDSPQTLLAAGLSDIATTGSTVASVRTRVEGSPEGWEHSHVATTAAPAHVISFGSHVDRVSGVHFAFAGLANGEIYRGGYVEALSARIAWASNSVELTQHGPITSFAECNGRLFAASGVRRPPGGGAGTATGGLLVRRDGVGRWDTVWTPPTPSDPSAPPTVSELRGLTAVPNPNGLTNEVLLLARSWPGVIERLDPDTNSSTPLAVELDVRDFFARQRQDDRIRTSSVTVGYTSFTPARHPVTGEAIHLIGLWLEDPSFNAPGGVLDGAWLIRHHDGTYEAASVGPQLDPSTPAPVAGFRATRCLALSPFPEDHGASFYLGGYDTGEDAVGAAADTAWIAAGNWRAWPAVNLSRQDGSSWELEWTEPDPRWILESTRSLTDPAGWIPVPEKPTRSPGRATVLVPSTPTAAFYRLHRVD